MRTEDQARVRGRRLDKSVLRYLREMIGVTRRFNRRDLRFEYEHAWEFAAQIIYGSFPQRLDYNTGLAPASIVTPTQPGPWSRPTRSQKPLRKIVKRFTRPHNQWEIAYETLECAHILLAPVGYSVPAKSRRCPVCGSEAAAKQKKPAARAISAARQSVSA